ncbi:MAG: MarR family winged helix-turn-helix transcriptional regulator [Pseudomonadota bacterium]
MSQLQSAPTSGAHRRKRRSDPVAHRGGVRLLNLKNYIPHLLETVSNPLSAGASAAYLARFELGVVDWRVISTLRLSPDLHAARICEVFEGDKAAVSRSLQRLAERGLAVFTQSARDPRRKTWALTEAGEDMHEKLLSVALGREEELVAGVDPDDLEVFLQVLRKMQGNVARMKSESGPSQ